MRTAALVDLDPFLEKTDTVVSLRVDMIAGAGAGARNRVAIVAVPETSPGAIPAVE